MKGLVKKLQDEHGLTEENAVSILITVKNYIKEQFPMISGAVDNLFQTETTTSDSTSSAAPGSSSDIEEFLD